MTEQLVPKLNQVIMDTQRLFAYDTLRLDEEAVADLTAIILDFAEDVRAGIGLWTAYERYNNEFFGTPLPFAPGTNAVEPAEDIHPDRLRHLLWVLYPEFVPGLILSPTHQDLERVVQAVCAFLKEAYPSGPLDSKVKSFFRAPNAYGWDVKRKLVWLGRESFMFRLFYDDYMADHAAADSDIQTTDDFVCQECTRWSGLGAIDILAGVLDISEDDRRDLRSWYERHASFYRVLSVGRESMRVLNIINDQPYLIRMDIRPPFKTHQLIFGSLVPWRGDWYWSGVQRTWGNARRVNVEQLRTDMKRTSSRIVCRFSKEYETQVRTLAAKHYQQIMPYYGKDLIVYPDGLAMAADWQKEMEYVWSLAPKGAVDELVKKHGLPNRRPQMPLPKEVLEHRNGLGVFINPDEGKEIACKFTLLVEAFKRRGKDLSEAEMDSIRGFVEASALSPGFVRRMVQEYGDESIKAAFCLGDNPPAYWLEYLLRTHKGHFYRKRYPAMAAI